MARKKQEIQLQTELETQEEYEDMLSKEGLIVIDVYQEWCGPCKAISANFRKLKNELGDDLLRFAVAKADSIDSLEKYRGYCEPCFLLLAAGCLVSAIHGANSPLLMKTITEQLAQEHRVLDGQAERKEIRDPRISQESEEEQRGMLHHGEHVIFDSLPESAVAGRKDMKDVTVAILKPDIVAAGKVDEIMEKLAEHGIEILEQQEKLFTEAEAREFYAHKSEEDYFEDLIEFMTSGPSRVLILTKGDNSEGIIEEWREMLGPAKVEDAKESAPDSLRAQYGNYTYVNALHGSDTQETAMKELAFFFPTYGAPLAGSKRESLKPQVQRTLALIRPDALAERKDEILAKIAEAGFTVAMQKTMQLSREQAENFYSEHRDQEYFADLVEQMSSGPLMALALAREDAVAGWRTLLGPKVVAEAKEEEPESLRAQFAKDDDAVNPLHGSDAMMSAEKEIDYFFPMQHTVALIKPDAYDSRDAIITKIEEAGFRVAAKNELSMSREMAEQFYKDQDGKDYFDSLTEHMISGKTLFMILTKADAVQGWRGMLGPPDPEQAKEKAPDSLRAQFGTDILSNAIHGSSSEQQADDSIKLVFGEVEFKPDGTCIVLSAKAMETAADEQPQVDAVTEEQPAEPAEAAETAQEGAPEEQTVQEPEATAEAPQEEAPAEAEPPAEPAELQEQVATTEKTAEEAAEPSDADGGVKAEVEPVEETAAETSAAEAEVKTEQEETADEPAEPSSAEAEVKTEQEEPADEPAEPSSAEAEVKTEQEEPAETTEATPKAEDGVSVAETQTEDEQPQEAAEPTETKEVAAEEVGATENKDNATDESDTTVVEKDAKAGIEGDEAEPEVAPSGEADAAAALNEVATPAVDETDIA